MRRCGVNGGVWATEGSRQMNLMKVVITFSWTYFFPQIYEQFYEGFVDMKDPGTDRIAWKSVGTDNYKDNTRESCQLSHLYRSRSALRVD